MDDLVWVRLLSPKPLNFFPQHILMFFQCNIFFPQVFLSPQNQSARYFLLKTPIPLPPPPTPLSPQKSNGRLLKLTLSTISEVLKKHRKNAETAKKRNLSQSWVKISVEEISNFSKNWTHLSIQSYSQYLSLFSHLNQPYNYLKTITKGIKVQDIEHNSQRTIKYQTR